MKHAIILASVWLCWAMPSQSAHAGGDVQAILGLVNQARARGASCGGRYYRPAPPLRLHAGLSRAARKWARYMVHTGRFAHSIDGSGFAKRIMAVCGRTAMAENLSGNRSARDTVRRLMRSPGHCRNIMNPTYRYIGIGKAAGGRYGAYWVQNFASRC
jgi:uncharacterized protein YkwD